MPLPQTNTPRPAREDLPTMYDLPSEEIGDAGMPDEFHALQAYLLDQTFRPPAISPDNYYKAVDMNLYYDVHHTSWYKHPDWFAAIGVPRFYEGRDSRLSYVAWQEPAPPLIIVELLSPGTEKEDLGETSREAGEPPPKWDVYEKILHIPYYAVFSRGYTELRIFRLMGGGYVEVIGHGGRYWIPEAGLGLGVWRGRHQGLDRFWLRWYDAERNWIPTYEELAEQEREEKEAALQREAQFRQQSEQERTRAEQAEQTVRQERTRAEQAEQAVQQERQRTAQLAEFLRQLGHDPDRL